MSRPAKATTAPNKQRPVLIADVGDVHAGSTLSLAPERIALDDGGEYLAAKHQRWLFQCWTDYWKQVEEARRESDATLYVIFGGDLVEGFHHGSIEVASGNPNAQAAILNECVSIPLALKPDAIVIVRGTPAHVGQSGSAEERIADGLRRDKRPIISCPDTNTASWNHFRAEIHGHLIDVAHEGRTGQREHTRQNAANLHAHDIYLSHCKRGDRAPDLCIRHHHHRFNDSYDACPTRVVTNGAWQLKTGWAHQKFADTMSDIGGLVVTVEPGRLDVRKVQYKADRGAVWRP